MGWGTTRRAPADSRATKPSESWMVDAVSGADFVIRQRTDGTSFNEYRDKGEMEKFFKSRHGNCSNCDSTGFERYERGSTKVAAGVDAAGNVKTKDTGPNTFVRRCRFLERRAPIMPPRDKRDAGGGFTKASEAAQSYGLKFDDDEMGGE